jgi:hypothetical protein
MPNMIDRRQDSAPGPGGSGRAARRGIPSGQTSIYGREGCVMEYEAAAGWWRQGAGCLGQRTTHTYIHLHGGQMDGMVWCVPMRLPGYGFPGDSRETWSRAGGLTEGESFLSSCDLTTSQTPSLAEGAGKGDPLPAPFGTEIDNNMQMSPWESVPHPQARCRLHSPKASAGHGMTARGCRAINHECFVVVPHTSADAGHSLTRWWGERIMVTSLRKASFFSSVFRG